jgi:predicted nuclease of predicted toxin-antitoxin system
MRLLANENFPLAAVVALREKGHDVLWIRTDAPGSRDDAILALATAEQRILITFDKDFGELAFRAKLPSTSGVILFRISIRSPDAVAGITITAVESRADWAGHFAVVEDSRIRLRPLA